MPFGRGRVVLGTHALYGTPKRSPILGTRFSVSSNGADEQSGKCGMVRNGKRLIRRRRIERFPIQLIVATRRNPAHANFTAITTTVGETANCTQSSNWYSAG